jgi:uncharacterized protein YqeY
VALKAQLDIDLKAALLGGDRFRGEVLRGLKAVILNEEVAKGLRETGLDDGTIETIIAREVKKRADSASQYQAAGRPELVLAEQAESKILEAYLPEQVSEAVHNLWVKLLAPSKANLATPRTVVQLRNLSKNHSRSYKKQTSFSLCLHCIRGGEVL